MLEIKTIDYQDGQTKLEGYLAYQDSSAEKRPAVLVVHDWSGRNEFACQKAEKLAELGYVGFALDMFGKGVLGKTNEEKSALIAPFMADRGLLAQRILSAYHVLKKIDTVDPARIGAIGFCFGGLCALDLARSGAEVRGIVSFHGLLSQPQAQKKPSIKAKILALHGYDDPMANHTQVSEFENEMTAAGVDWQLHMYGQTKHAFTNPLANDDKLGTVYNKIADQRSWQAMQNFFTEIFN